jgi:hypothetical protein
LNTSTGQPVRAGPSIGPQAITNLMLKCGKLGKPKHNFKVHLFGGISRQGLTPLKIFTCTMFSGDFQNFLTASFLPFIRLKFPYGHRFFMDNDPKHNFL